MMFIFMPRGFPYFSGDLVLEAGQEKICFQHPALSVLARCFIAAGFRLRLRSKPGICTMDPHSGSHFRGWRGGSTGGAEFFSGLDGPIQMQG